MTRGWKIALVMVAGLLLPVGVASAAGEGFVAGTTPDRRPEGAPKVSKSGLSKEEWAAALKGVSEPYPASLSFLDNQGGWWTPFAHPGMPGPYDIRNLHKK